MLISSIMTLVTPALAQSDPEPVEGFVRYISISTPRDVDPGPVRDRVEIELRDWGLSVSRCDELRELDKALDEEIDERYPTWRFDPDLMADKQVLTARCTPSDSTTAFYVVKVSLAVDPERGNQRRANVQILPLGDRDPDARTYVGGYAHRPFVESAAWSDVLLRALDRALSGADEPPSVYVRGPRRARLGMPTTVTSRGSWDPDGDPFVLRWSATIDACVGTTRSGAPVRLPKLRDCPRGTEPAEDMAVDLGAGQTSQDRVLDPPMIGTYTVSAVPRARGLEAPSPSTHRVVVEPGHPSFFGLNATLVRLPGDLFVFGDRESLAPHFGMQFLTRAATGFTRRYVHDLLLGLSMSVLTRDGDALQQSDALWTIGGDLVGRLYGERGRWGVEYGARVGLGTATVAVQNTVPTDRSAWLPIEARLGVFRQDRRVTHEADRPCRGLACTTLGVSVTGSMLVVTESGNVGISLGPQLHASLNP